MTPYEFNLSGNEVVTVTATSAQSAALPYNKVHLVATQNMWLNFGSNPTATAATTGNVYLPANREIVIKFNAGAKIAAVRDSADGKLSITPVSF